MNTLDFFFSQYEFNRKRTLDLLETIEKDPQCARILAYRPGPGRAHIAWQLLHIGVTEEMFASERLAPHKEGAWQDAWPRFRGGSTPDDDIPSAAFIRELLNGSRERLIATLREFPESRLGEIPASMAKRGWTVRTILSVLAWHEPHHQGQAHLTLNLYRAAHPS
jgi:uncharacterized damage-inducible protein DinB